MTAPRAALESDAAWVRELAQSAGLQVDLAHELTHPQALAWVLDPERGFLTAWLVAGELQIQDLAVSPAHRRHGIGRALLAHALREAQVQAAFSASLELRKSNQAALSLYQRLGFLVVGERPRYYPDGEAALLLSLTFSS